MCQCGHHAYVLAPSFSGSSLSYVMGVLLPDICLGTNGGRANRDRTRHVVILSPDNPGGISAWW